MIFQSIDDVNISYQFWHVEMVIPAPGPVDDPRDAHGGSVRATAFVKISDVPEESERTTGLIF